MARGEQVIFTNMCMVTDKDGRVLVQDRSDTNWPGMVFPGGHVEYGESFVESVIREVWEETGIQADADEFEYLCSSRSDSFFFDHYCLHRDISLDKIKLLPGETDDVMWASFETVHDHKKKICHIIAEQFLQMESELLRRQTAQ